VIREAIVNAVAHRDYTSKGSIQVMLFSDRLEIWNPGSLPHALSLEKLRHPHGSFPANPLLAEPLYLTKYIERMGTGTGDMIVRCREAGLPEPEFALSDGFVTTIRRKADVAFGIVGGSISPSTEQLTEQATEQVTEQVNRLVSALSLTPLSAKALMKLLRLQHRPTFIYTYLRPALEVKLVESTEPDSPTSPTQKYRLTAKGHAAQEAMKKKR
jgi:predicted HTH transcriptional regulator